MALYKFIMENEEIDNYNTKRNSQNVSAEGNIQMDIQENRKSVSSLLWSYLLIGSAEFLGTAILIFLSCTGSTIGVQKSDTSFVHISLTSGLAVMVVIQMFGHISGAHVNPAISMAALILNEITISQIPVYVISQISGCLVGYGFHKLVTPEIHMQSHNVTGRGVCVTAPHSDLSEVEALVVEIILTIILVIANCSAWDSRNSHKSDSVALRIGLTVASLNFSAAAYTGASMNPVRSFGPAVWTSDYTAHWIYWIGPLVGSLLGVTYYKFVFSKVK